MELRDDAHERGEILRDDDISELDAALDAGPVGLVVRLSDPASMPDCDDSAACMLRAALAIRRILAIAARRPRLQSLTINVDPPGDGRTIIHPMMQDLRRAQSLLLDPPETGLETEATALGLRAGRVIDQLLSPPGDKTGLLPRRLSDYDLIFAMRNRPLYRTDATDLDWDRRKTHVALFPRRATPNHDRPIGVFVHLYYAELALPIAERLAGIQAPIRIHASTDDEEKARIIAAAMPDAQVRVMPNRGRDIAPKFYGFSDAYRDHDIVLHLHGKRSLFSERLDGWMAHILDCLLPEPAEINRILSFFKDIDRLGLIAPQAHRPVLRAMHWTRNQEIAEELRLRLGMTAPLPEDDDLVFPAGSMFWARTAALRPLLDLPLGPEHFPPERGQLDGTLAHAIERMIGVTCQQGGFQMIRVAPSGNKAFPKQKFAPASNAELRDWLSGDQSLRKDI